MMNFLYYILGTILGFVGINAAVSGMLLMLDPSGVKMGLTVAMLSHSPFADYRIPGAILFAVNGLGSLAGAWLAFRRHRLATLGGLLLGAILCGWILFQLMWIEYSWLQPTLFVIGCLEMFFSLLIIRIMLTRAKRDKIAKGT